MSMPVSVDEFRIGAGEVYDVIVQPPEEAPYTIFAQSMDGSGFARGTLAPRAGMRAPIPAHGSAAACCRWQTWACARHGTCRDAQPRHDDNRGRRHARRFADDSLDDPGVGLRGNGRRVLTYADLHTIGGALDTRPPLSARSSCISPDTCSVSCGRSMGANSPKRRRLSFRRVSGCGSCW
jgi:hypothetical protein